MKLTFKPLSKENLQEGINLLKEIFPEDASEAERHYNESLDPNNPSWKTHLFWRYYIAFDYATNEPVGVTGFYHLTEHDKGEVWLGWFGVSPSDRGKGFGKKILEWTFQTAKDNGFNKLRLWTTTSPDEAVAQKLYDSVGLKIYNQERYKNTNFEKLYREKNL